MWFLVVDSRDKVTTSLTNVGLTTRANLVCIQLLNCAKMLDL